MTEPSSEIPPNKPFALGKRSKSALKFMAVDPSIPVPIEPMATATSPPSPSAKSTSEWPLLRLGCGRKVLSGKVIA